MDTNHSLYQLVADAVRRHSGSEELIDEVHALFLDELESLVAARVEELNNTTRISDDGAGDRRHDSTDLPTAAEQAKELPMPTKAEMFPSKYLSAADLNGRSIVLKIKSATEEMLDQEPKMVLGFNGTSKALVLNKTNWDSVVDATGQVNSNDWVGHQIEVFPTTTTWKGQTVPCVRVKSSMVRQAAKPADGGDFNDEIPF